MNFNSKGSYKMSTYTDLKNRIKENLVVDYKGRTTTQEAKFLNRNNEYWGSFRGRVDAEYINLVSGDIKNTTIKDSVLIDPILSTRAGQIIDLGNLGNELQALSTEVTERIPAQISSLCRYADMISANTDELSAALILSVNTLCGMISAGGVDTKELWHAIETEIAERISSDDIISTKLTDALNAEIAQRDYECKSIKNSLSIETDARIAADDQLSATLVDKIDTDIVLKRHYQIVTCNSREYPVKAADYSVNVLRNIDVPYARVKLNERSGLDIGSVIGYTDDSVTIRPNPTIECELSDALKHDFTLKVGQDVTLNTYIATLTNYMPGRLSNAQISFNKAENTWTIYNGPDAIATLRGVKEDNSKFVYGTFNEVYGLEGFEWANDRLISANSFIANGDYEISCVLEDNLTKFKFVSGLVRFEELSDETGDAFAKVYEHSVISTDDALQEFSVKLNDVDEQIKLISPEFTTEYSEDEIVRFDNMTKTLSVTSLQRKYAYEVGTQAEMFHGSLSVSDVNARLSSNTYSTISAELIYDDETTRHNVVVLMTTEDGDHWSGRTEKDGWIHTAEFSRKSFDIKYIAKQGESSAAVLTVIGKVNDIASPYEISDIAKHIAPVTFDFSQKKEPAEPIVTIATPKSNLPPYTAAITDGAKISFEIPDPLSASFAREMMFVIKPAGSLTDPSVEVQFVDTDGNELQFFDEEHYSTIKIKRGQYTTLKLQEVCYSSSSGNVDKKNHSIFHLTDFNDNFDHDAFRQLKSRVEALEDWALLSASLSVYELNEKIISEINTRQSDDMYLSSQISDLCNLVHDISSEITSSVSSISSYILSTMSDVSNEILTTINEVSSDILSTIDDVSAYLSTELTNQISGVSVNILASLDHLSGKYDSTISAIDMLSNDDLSVGNLMLMDVDPVSSSSRIHDKYYVTFKYGTMVLKKLN